MYTSCVLGVAFFGSLIYIALLPIKNIYALVFNAATVIWILSNMLRT